MNPWGHAIFRLLDRLPKLLQSLNLRNLKGFDVFLFLFPPTTTAPYKSLPPTLLLLLTLSSQWPDPILILTRRSRSSTSSFPSFVLPPSSRLSPWLRFHQADLHISLALLPPSPFPLHNTIPCVLVIHPPFATFKAHRRSRFDCCRGSRSWSQGLPQPRHSY